MATDRSEQFLSEGKGCCRLYVLFFAYAVRRLLQEADIFPFGAPCGGFNQLGSNQQVNVNVLCGGNSLGKSVAPSLETIDPSFNGVFVASRFRDRKRTSPAIVTQRCHG